MQVAVGVGGISLEIGGEPLVDEGVVAKFVEFLSLPRLQEKLGLAAQKFPEAKSVELDWAELSNYDYELADGLLEGPDAYSAAAEEAIARMKIETPGEEEYRPNARFWNLPDLQKTRPMVLDLGSQHLDKLVAIDGVVSSISEIKPRIRVALWKCANPACGKTTKTYTEKTLPVVAPLQCEHCNKSAFKLLEKSSDFVDMQRASLQDPVEKLRGNTPAVHVDLWMEDDLVNKIAPGDKVVITGVLRLKPIIQGKGRSSVYAKFFDVFHLREVEIEFEELEVTKEEEGEIRKLSRDPKLFEKIVASVAPSLYGYNELKQAIALQLFGGTPNKFMPDGERIRSDAHILLCGDPGTGKSTMLEYVANLAPKAVVVSGGSASGVGLTASAERDEITEGWVLKAGAMVLANGGMICLDEADKMDEEDRGAMHQAMEQQRINVAKAGIVTEFQTRCAVLAAANPKLGRFDPNMPLPQQFALSPALLSRFDLIFTMRDVLDEARDKKMAEHILVGHIYAGRGEAGKGKQAEEEQMIMPAINPDLLRKYIAYARKNIAPQITPEAAEKLKDYYVELRRLGKEQNTFPVTARSIEGLIRLAEASAKARLSPMVEVQDAQRAIDLSDFVLREVFVDRETGKLDSDVVSLGQAKSRTDKLRTILDIIDQMQKEVDDGLVAIDDVVREAANYGIDEGYSRTLIDERKRQGDLYEPKPGFVKSARRRAT